MVLILVNFLFISTVDNVLMSMCWKNWLLEPMCETSDVGVVWEDICICIVYTEYGYYNI